MIYAMSMMVFLTAAVAFVAVRARFSSVKNREMKASYFSLMQGSEMPDQVAKTTRNFNNLFEVPILFYVVCTLFVALEIESILATTLAWAFVVLRCVHSYIHINRNHVRHRLIAFFTSFLCAVALWVVLLVKVS